MKTIRKLKFVILALLANVCLVSSASALVVSDTQSVGLIGEYGVDGGTAFSFDLGTTFTSINSVQFVFQACPPGNFPPGCTDSIGTAEQVILALGPDMFNIANQGFDQTIDTFLGFSAALAADLLDGLVSGLVWIDELPGYDFVANVSFADLTLIVDGETRSVPEPSSLLMLAFALLGLGFIRKGEDKITR